MARNDYQLLYDLPVTLSDQQLSPGPGTEGFKVEGINESMDLSPTEQSDDREVLLKKAMQLYAAALQTYHRSRLVDVRMYPVLKPQYNRWTRGLRLQFAMAHVDWQEKDWLSVLFSHKTWVPEIHPECGGGCVRRKSGYMLWISIIDGRKGSAVILDYSQMKRTVSASHYIQHILPSVERMRDVRGRNTPFLFQHSDAPSHTARETVEALENKQILTMNWPPCSPDLNPVATVGRQLNEYLQIYFSERMTKDGLHSAITNSWDAFPNENVYHVISTMRERCEAVIRAGGGPTWFSH